MAERRVFEALAAAEYPEATALHSLRLSRHEYKATGELDFVIVSPLGVLVLEVKGGGVRCDTEGIWWFIDRYGERRSNSEGPFRQAEEGMWSLRNLLLRHLPKDEVKALTFGFAVVFPDCDFDVTSVEWDPEVVIDNRRLNTADGMGSLVRRIQRYWRARRRQSSDNAPRLVLDRVISRLRPRFDRVVSLSVRAREIDYTTERLTEEQYSRLDIIEASPRIVCCGGAGTGKTFLALELCRRHVGRGQRTILTTTNARLLAFLAGRADTTGIRFVPFEGLPREAPADVLVVDEAQDILDFAGLDVLSSSLNGGLESGCWRIFLDPNGQAALAGRFDPAALAYLDQCGAVRADLRRNCRNTADIVLQTQLLTGADLGVAKAGSGPEVEYAWFADRATEAEALAGHLERLYSEDVAPGDVTVLSALPRAQSCFSALPRHLVRNAVEVSRDVAARWPVQVLTFSTIEDFKGLENRFICVVDIERFGDPQSVALVYVAMSRARAGLWLAIHKSLEGEVRAASVRNLQILTGKEGL